MGNSLDQSRARHVAIIMDGNGRWAKKRALPRAVGHQRGVEAVRRLVRALDGTGLECLTLYAFSSENWKRPDEEVDDLMNLMRRFIRSDLPEFVANKVKLKIIGDWQSLAPDIVAMLEDALAQTAGGTQSLAVAVRALATRSLTSANAKRVVMRELVGGVLNGLGLAIILGLAGFLIFGDWKLGVVLGVAMICNQIVAAMGGVLVPLTLSRMKLDPALASGTFVTTLTDVLGYLTFLGLASMFLL